MSAIVSLRKGKQGVQITPETGQPAIVRKRPFVVTGLMLSALGLGGHGARPNRLTNLSLIEDDGLGEDLRVMWAQEPGTAVPRRPTRGYTARIAGGGDSAQRTHASIG